MVLNVGRSYWRIAHWITEMSDLPFGLDSRPHEKLEEGAADSFHPLSAFDAESGTRVCSNCKSSKHTVLVWDEVEDWEDDADPDYVGCTDCSIMEEVVTLMFNERY
jgi:hypothetical protein